MTLLALGSTACATLNAYDAQQLGNHKPAHVSGDYHLRAGAVVNVFLRSVDGQALQVWQHAADIDAGPHELLVDCQVTATNKLSRHALKVSLESGVNYRLSAEANDQQGCTLVTLEERN